MEFLQNIITYINTNKYFAGILMLTLNIGSKYIQIQLTETQQEIIRGKYARQFLIFTMLWVGTRDVVTSIVLTASFIILTDYLFNEHSNVCVLPKKYKALKKVMDTNNDGKVSDSEIKNAISILEKARKETEQLKHRNALNNFISNL